MVHHAAGGAVANEIQRVLQLPNKKCVKLKGFKELIGRLERVSVYFYYKFVSFIPVL